MADKVNVYASAPASTPTARPEGQQYKDYLARPKVLCPMRDAMPCERHTCALGNPAYEAGADGPRGVKCLLAAAALAVIGGAE